MKIIAGILALALVGMGALMSAGVHSLTHQDGHSTPVASAGTHKK